MTTILDLNAWDVATAGLVETIEPKFTTSPATFSLVGIVDAVAGATDPGSLTYIFSSDCRSIFDPAPLLAVLCLCYARGIYASADIERAAQYDRQIQQVCQAAIPDTCLLRRFRDDNWNAIRTCLAKVLWNLAEQKVAAGFVTKVNRTHVEQEALRRMITAAFLDDGNGLEN